MNNSCSIQSSQELLFRQSNDASRKVYREGKSLFLHLIDLQRMQKVKMPRNGYADAERAQCVLWIAEGYEKTEVQRLFMEKYEKNPPTRSGI